MKHLTANAARKDFDAILGNVSRFHEPVTIVSNDDSAVVVISVDEWNSIQETLYLQSIPGMPESIKAAAAESLECGTPATEVD